MVNQSLKSWLGEQKLQNYGYDYKHFRKMVSLKAQLKKKLYNTPEKEVRKSLAIAGVLGKGRRLSQAPIYQKTKEGKFVKTSQRQWDYTTGQSFNEELMNMLELSTSGGKKSFWERTERGFWD